MQDFSLRLWVLVHCFLDWKSLGNPKSTFFPLDVYVYVWGEVSSKNTRSGVTTSSVPAKCSIRARARSLTSSSALSPTVTPWTIYPKIIGLTVWDNQFGMILGCPILRSPICCRLKQQNPWLTTLEKTNIDFEHPLVDHIRRQMLVMFIPG